MIILTWMTVIIAMMTIKGGRIVVTLTFVAGFFMVFYKDRLFIKTKSLDYASKMMGVLE